MRVALGLLLLASCATPAAKPNDSTLTALECDNGVRDRNEADLDCGSVCNRPCPDYKGCVVDADCISNACGASNACLPAGPFPLGGTVVGLVGTGLILANGTDTLAVTVNGPFVFTAQQPSGSAYAASIAAQPMSPAQTCVIMNGSGEVAGVAVSNIVVSCTTDSVTLSGTAGGLPPGGITLKNGDTQLQVPTDGVFSFPPVMIGTAYAVEIVNPPTDRECGVVQASGTLVTSVDTLKVFCIGSVQPTYAVSRFTHWLRRTDPSTECTAGDKSPFGACVHAGELRQLSLPTLTSCAGISAQDTLGIFEWRCDESASPVRVVSKGFAAGRGVRDAVAASGSSFRSNSLAVQVGGSTLHSTTSVWWDNPLLVDNDGGSFAVPDQIVVKIANANGSYTFTADHQALLAMPGKPVTNSSTLVQSGSAFLWFEGEAVRNAGSAGIAFSGARSVVRNVRVSGNSTSSTAVSIASASGVQNLVVSNANTCLAVGSGSAVISALLTDCGQTALQVSGSNVLISNVTATAASNAYGVDLSSSYGAVGIGILSASNRGGINVASGGDHTLMGLTVVENSNIGSFNGGLSSTFPRRLLLANVLSADNIGGNLSASAGMLAITHYRGIQSSLSLAGAVGTDALVAENCGAGCGPFVSDTSLTDLGSAFVAAGPVGPTGQPTDLAYNASTPLSPFQAWGDDIGGSSPGAFLTTSWAGICGPGPGLGTCRLNDWRLRASDTVARAVRAAPGSSAGTHRFSGYVSQEECDFAYPGTHFDTYGTNGGYCEASFLPDAIEILGDTIGNDDGLCQSNEECILMPNIGAYQGEGALVFDSIVNAAGQTNVRLYRYGTNGI